MLCPFDRTGRYLEGLPRYQPMDGKEGAWWSPDHVSMLQELEWLYDLAWCTGWVEEDLREHLEPLYFLVDEKPIMPFNTLGEGKTYKLHEVTRFVGDRPVVWVDDDLFSDAYEWARERDKTIPTKLVHTDSALGLTREEMQILRLLAKENNAL